MTSSTSAPPIIMRPERQGMARRTLYGIATALLWAVYLYLLLPVVTLVAWLLGMRRAAGTLFGDVETVDPFLLIQLPLIALACAATLVAWAEYNRIRFQGNDHRKSAPHVAPAQLGHALGASDGIGPKLRGESRILTVTLDPAARPVMVDARG